ncbi:Ankyrin repeat-containing protein [Spatholobus suberectus]|nr:Ankyrin repeat-containing protein [Spatholobus suberectus]
MDVETKEPSAQKEEPQPENKFLRNDINQATEAARDLHVENQIEFEPSIFTGTPVTHGEKDKIELLGKVYHLVHGGALRDSRDFSNATQTRTPVLESTMLHIAAWHGNNEVVDLVAKQAPKLLFSRNKNDDTALHVAARAGHISTVEKLLEAYSNFQRPEIAKAWIEFMGLNDKLEVDNYDEETNVKDLIHLMKLKNNQGNIMLHEAMMCSRSNGSNIFQVLEPYEAQDDIGESLSGSCYKFALNTTNSANQSVLYLAVEAGHMETVIRILEKCHENEMPQGLSPLVAAIMKRDEDMLSTILGKREEWIHLKDTHERLPLHYAASTGYLEGVVHLLEKCKSCSNQKDHYDFLPLHLASHGGHVEVVEELLKYCLDTSEMLDKSGRNILHIAARSGKYEVVRYILLTPELEGMINQKDMEGNTPLHLASKWCHPKTAYALTWDDRVDLGLVNQHKQTALDFVNAVYQSQKENPSLQQRLTWTALKSAGAKQSSRKIVPVEFSPNNLKPKEAKVEQSKDDRVTNTEPYKDRVETLEVVSTLIVTASVAACLAVPGEADGAAKNLNHTMFHFFIFSITISLFSSISATIILFWTRLGVVQLLAYALKLVMPLLGVALISLSLAFMAGLYTVISKLSWLATTFLVISMIFIVVVFFLYILLFLPSTSTSKPLRYISYYPFIFLASLAESGT